MATMWMPGNPQLGAARDFHVAGISVVPPAPDGSKRPWPMRLGASGSANWLTYTKRRPTPEELVDWFTSGHTGIGVVCGAVSGGLLCLDVEGRAVAEGVWDAYLEACNSSGLGPLVTRVLSGYCEITASGGRHLLWKVEGGEAGGVVAGNQKLARRPATEAELAEHPQAKVQVLIETRGEGGYVITAPSNGTVHPHGGAWVMESGGPDTIATITAEESEALLDVARTLDAMPLPAAAVTAAESQLFQKAPRGSGAVSEVSPGQDFEAAVSWEQILIPHGWRKLFTSGSKTAWCRPGKTSGVSATTGCSQLSGDYLYVFSTSTGFEDNRSYTKFGAYAVLEHNGDHSAAARALRGEGFGSPLATTPAAPVTAPQQPAEASPPVAAPSLPAGGPEGVLVAPGDALAVTPSAILSPAQAMFQAMHAAEAIEIARGSRVDLTELLSKDLPEMAWIVPGLIPAGLGIVSAPPKVGKSFMMLQIAVCVATGTSVFGCLPAHRRQVLYMALEDGERRLKKRAAKMPNVSRVQRGDLAFQTVTARLDKGGLAAITDWIDSSPNPGLVIIDVLQAFRPLSDGSGKRNAYAEDYETLQALARLANDRQIAIICVHHNSKGRSSDALEMLSGSTGMTGAVDWVAVIKRGRDEDKATMFITGRDVENAEVLIDFGDGGVWTAETIPDRMAQASGTAALALAHIEEHGPSKAYVVAEALGAKTDTVYRALCRMADAGRVVRLEGGGKGSVVTWALPAALQIGRSDGQAVSVPNASVSVPASEETFSDAETLKGGCPVRPFSEGGAGGTDGRERSEGVVQQPQGGDRGSLTLSLRGTERTDTTSDTSEPNEAVSEPGGQEIPQDILDLCSGILSEQPEASDVGSRFFSKQPLGFQPAPPYVEPDVVELAKNARGETLCMICNTAMADCWVKAGATHHPMCEDLLM